MAVSALTLSHIRCKFCVLPDAPVAPLSRQTRACRARCPPLTTACSAPSRRYPSAGGEIRMLRDALLELLMVLGVAPTHAAEPTGTLTLACEGERTQTWRVGGFGEEKNDEGADLDQHHHRLRGSDRRVLRDADRRMGGPPLTTDLRHH